VVGKRTSGNAAAGSLLTQATIKRMCENQFLSCSHEPVLQQTKDVDEVG
jgi:hypothetical protein